MVSKPIKIDPRSGLLSLGSELLIQEIQDPVQV
jgi:hypothetical protein